MASASVSHSPLDDAVEVSLRELRNLGAPTPDSLFLLAAGARLLSDRLENPGAIPLGSIDELPELWRGRTLHHGQLGGSSVWILEDVSGDPGGWEPESSWAAGLPCWLAAEAGARLCIHTAAGSALPATSEGETPEVGTIGLVRDHINLSGESPLVAIGESRLGPLFPDLTQLHHNGLRNAALIRARKLGITSCEVVAACTQGPNLSTPAESRWLAHAGAQVAMLDVAAPYLAAAHSGLSLLAICAITSAGTEPVDVAQLVAQSQSLAPALEDLLVALAPEIASTAREPRSESGL